VNIRGKRHYLWRAVDQDGDVIDILVQKHRNARAAKRFFRKLLKGQGSEPWHLVTDKLRSYAAAHRNIMPSVVHDTTLCQQPGRNLTSADATTRTTDETVQISWTGPAIPVGARCGTEPLQVGTAPPTIGELPVAARPILRRMECGYGCLSNPATPASTSPEDH
jgi:hypothetical protein